MSVTIHNRITGAPITPIETEYECSWVLNSEGKCSFPFSLEDSKAAHKLILNAGNYIYISHEKLPPWGGVLDGDEDWNGDGTFTLAAWSGEYLLNFRRSPMNETIQAASAGALIVKMINMANTAGDLLIRPGNIWSGGGQAEELMDGKSIYTHVKDVAKRHNIDWSIDPVLDAKGNLYFKLNVYEKRGITSSRVLKEGHNITAKDKPLQVKTGEIVKDVLGLDDASTDVDRPTYIAINAASITKYGLRQGTEDFSGVTDPQTVENNTKKSLKIKAKPKRIHKADALDVEGTFKDLGLGNIYPLSAFSYGKLTDGRIGVDEPARLMGMRYKQSNNIVEITSFDEVL